MYNRWQATRAARIVAETVLCILVINLWFIRDSRSEATQSTESAKLNDEQVQEAFDRAYRRLQAAPRTEESLHEAMRLVEPALKAQRDEVARQQKAERQKLAPKSKNDAKVDKDSVVKNAAASIAPRSSEVEIDPATVPKEIEFKKKGIGSTPSPVPTVLSVPSGGRSEEMIFVPRAKVK